MIVCDFCRERATDVLTVALSDLGKPPRHESRYELCFECFKLMFKEVDRAVATARAQVETRVETRTVLNAEGKECPAPPVSTFPHLISITKETWPYTEMVREIIREEIQRNEEKTEPA